MYVLFVHSAKACSRMYQSSVVGHDEGHFNPLNTSFNNRDMSSHDSKDSKGGSSGGGQSSMENPHMKESPDPLARGSEAVA